jgi:hypothetical protein
MPEMDIRANSRNIRLNSIKELIKKCLDQLYTDDKVLFEKNKGRGASERCLVFRFAHYLQNELNNSFADYKFFVDCDYNSSYEKKNNKVRERTGKPMRNTKGLIKGLFIDIIVHKRNSNAEDDDFICFEIKPWHARKKYEDDFNKLEQLTTDYRYLYGFRLVFGKTKDLTQWTIFQNGTIIERDIDVFQNFAKNDKSTSKKPLKGLAYDIVIALVTGIISGYLVYMLTILPHIVVLGESFHYGTTDVHKSVYSMNMSVINDGLKSEDNLTIEIRFPPEYNISNIELDPSFRVCYLYYHDPIGSNYFEFANCPLSASSTLLMRLDAIGPPTEISIGCNADQPTCQTTSLKPLVNVTITGADTLFNQEIHPNFGTYSKFYFAKSPSIWDYIIHLLRNPPFKNN